jgi:protein-disulfide isomerase
MIMNRVTRSLISDLITGAVAVVGLMLAAMWVIRLFVGAPAPSPVRQPWSTLASGAHLVGRERAERRILELGDYRCGFCRQLHDTLKLLLARYPDNVALYYRPLVPSANVQSASYLLAMGAECAAEQNRFQAFHDAAFEMARATVNRTELARLAGMADVPNAADFERCMDDDRHSQTLEAARSMATEMKVPGTPVLYINGQWYAGAISMKELGKIVFAQRDRAPGTGTR